MKARITKIVEAAMGWLWRPRQAMGYLRYSRSVEHAATPGQRCSSRRLILLVGRHAWRWGRAEVKP